MRKLKIDLWRLAETMHHPEMLGLEYFLDTLTGEIFSLPEEVFDALETEEELETLPVWQQPLLYLANRVLNDEDKRFLRIPADYPFGDFDLMSRFAESVTDAKLRLALQRALFEEDAQDKFALVIETYPNERRRWFEVRDTHEEQVVRHWLEQYGLQAESDPGPESS